jgi:hypothetical protein
MTEELLTLDDIAALYRISRTHARDTLTKKPGFPQRVPGSTRAKPLWLREAIMGYMRNIPHESRTNA